MAQAQGLHHAYPIKHKLKECTMMKNFMTSGAITKGKKLEGHPGGKSPPPILGEEEVMSIYGGPVTHESWCKINLMNSEVNVVNSATLMYLRWSESQITFDLMDHPYCVPKPERFPLMVDPLVGTTRLTKALIDGGSGLNLVYLDTFDGLGLGRDLLKTSPQQFYGVVPGEQSIPLGQIILPITFKDVSKTIQVRAGLSPK
jgi:hypothetical protein